MNPYSELHEIPSRSERYLYTAEEAAALLSIGRQTLYELIIDGRLPSVTIDHLLRIREEDLRAFVRYLTDDDFDE